MRELTLDLRRVLDVGVCSLSRSEPLYWNDAVLCKAVLLREREWGSEEEVKIYTVDQSVCGNSMCDCMLSLAMPVICIYQTSCCHSAYSYIEMTRKCALQYKDIQTTNAHLRYTSPKDTHQMPTCNEEYLIN